MTERPALVVGLMSGTSLDGMDAALVRFSGPMSVELLGFVTRPYDRAEREELEGGMTGGGPAELARLHARIGAWASEAVDLLLEATRVSPRALDLIAFPGQTVWHEPPTVSWQLGEPAMLAERFGVRIVSQFRSRDVAAGGQGAPLVPMADVLLFGGAARRVLLNLGGMANLTVVPRRGVDEGAFGFDTGPGMAIIDALARRVDPSLPFDLDGTVSARGTVQEEVLRELLTDPWFTRPPPKSTGREVFGASYARALAGRLPGPDGVATAVALTATSITDALRRWVLDGGGDPGHTAPLEVVVSGGGSRHPGVMRGLAELEGVEVRRFDEVFFDGDAKEAVAFALLGYLCAHGQPGNLPAATGATGPRVLGQITPP